MNKVKSVVEVNNKPYVTKPNILNATVKPFVILSSVTWNQAHFQIVVSPSPKAAIIQKTRMENPRYGTSRLKRYEIRQPPKKTPTNTPRIHMKKVTFGLDIVINRNMTNMCVNNLQLGFKEARKESFAFIRKQAPFFHALTGNGAVESTHIPAPFFHQKIIHTVGLDTSLFLR